VGLKQISKMELKIIKLFKKSLTAMNFTYQLILPQKCFQNSS